MTTPLMHRVEDAAQLLGLSRTYVFQLIGSGELPSVLVGGTKRRIRHADLEAYVRSLPTEQGEAPARSV